MRIDCLFEESKCETQMEKNKMLNANEKEAKGREQKNNRKKKLMEPPNTVHRTSNILFSLLMSIRSNEDKYRRREKRRREKFFVFLSKTNTMRVAPSMPSKNTQKSRERERE